MDSLDNHLEPYKTTFNIFTFLEYLNIFYVVTSDLKSVCRPAAFHTPHCKQQSHANNKHLVWQASCPTNTSHNRQAGSGFSRCHPILLPGKPTPDGDNTQTGRRPPRQNLGPKPGGVRNKNSGCFFKLEICWNTLRHNLSHWEWSCQQQSVLVYLCILFTRNKTFERMPR